MTRPLQSKLLYVTVLLLLGSGVFVAYWMIPYDKSLVLIVAVTLLLIPGRIQGFVFRDHYRGRRLLGAGRAEEAVQCSRRFLAQIREKPWKKRFIWFTWGVYSWDVEAMTLNNMGAAFLNMGEFEDAEAYLRQALAVDPKYGVPYFNLAVLAAVQGNEKTARKHAGQAESLGYRRTRLDRVVHLAQAVLAEVEGRGVTKK